MFDDIENGLFRQSTSLRFWRQNLTDTVISSITWKNLPKTIDPMFIEKALFNNGKIIFFKAVDQNGKECLVCANGVNLGQMNLYGNFYNRQVIGANGFTTDLTADNSVLCWNNISHTPEKPRCEYYAKRIAQLDNIIDNNCYAQKTPVFFTANDADRLSMQNALGRYDADVPVIKVTQEFNPDAIKVFNANIDYKGNQLRETQSALITEYLTYNGIFDTANKNSQVTLIAEIATQNYSVELNQQAKMKPRLQAVEMINNMFSDLLEQPVEVEIEQGLSIKDMSGNFAVDDIQDVQEVLPGANNVREAERSI